MEFRQFGLVGKNLGHSFSKGFFTDKFIREHLNCRYDNFEIPSIEYLPGLINSTPAFRGLNVTIPYKKEVLSFLHKKDDIVKETGACNCIKIVNNEWWGYNTDVIGFKKSLEGKLQPYHNSALILGTGGASKAVAYVLKQSGIHFKFVSRNAAAGQWKYDDLDEDIIKEYLLIINTTPLGMFPGVNLFPPIPYAAVTDHHFLFDLIYNPEQTIFLQKGAERGAQISNGYEMLVLQAEESWRIWNQVHDL